LIGNRCIPWFDERHEKTQEDKKGPTGRIPTATSDCYSLHHRPMEPEKQQRRTNQMCVEASEHTNAGQVSPIAAFRTGKSTSFGPCLDL